MPGTAHRAKFILAEPGLLLQNAVITVSSSGRITGIGPWKSSPVGPKMKVTDWGSAVIMPGLINAHSHLELTSLRGQLTGLDSFADWISRLIHLRRRWTEADFTESALEGARACLSSGTTLVGDITSSGAGWKATRGERLRRVVFEETLALDPDGAHTALSQVKRLFRRALKDALMVHAISPHAPYSVSPVLYTLSAKLARNRGTLLATHVAETRAELRFLEDGSGELKDFLITMGSMPKEWKSPGMPPIPYLHSLGALGRNCLLVHCNYVDRESIRVIESTGSSVAYCPRSHHFFRHKRHPVRHLLDAGVNVALGTDSLASNSTLSMMDEIRFLFKKRKDLKAEEIFKAATLSGAEALGFGGILGRLKRGHMADMAVLEVSPGTKPKLLLDQILEGSGECVASIVQGQTAWQKAG